MLCWSSLFIIGVSCTCINSHFNGAFVFETVRRFLILLEIIVLFSIINIIWWLTSCLGKELLLCMCVCVCVYICMNVCIPFQCKCFFRLQWCVRHTWKYGSMILCCKFYSMCFCQVSSSPSIKMLYFTSKGETLTKSRENDVINASTKRW